MITDVWQHFFKFIWNNDFICLLCRQWGLIVLFLLRVPYYHCKRRKPPCICSWFVCTIQVDTNTCDLQFNAYRLSCSKQVNTRSFTTTLKGKQDRAATHKNHFFSNVRMSSNQIHMMKMILIRYALQSEKIQKVKLE